MTPAHLQSKLCLQLMIPRLRQSKQEREFVWNAVYVLLFLHLQWFAYKIAKEIHNGDNTEISGTNFQSIKKLQADAWTV